MPEALIRILLDQNIPSAIAGWLRIRQPRWDIYHINELGFQGRSDEFVYLWAKDKGALIITFDEDFADARLYPLGRHQGVVRLRVWPTTTEMTQTALERLFAEVPVEALRGSLVIVDNHKTRVRRA